MRFIRFRPASSDRAGPFRLNATSITSRRNFSSSPAADPRDVKPRGSEASEQLDHRFSHAAAVFHRASYGKRQGGLGRDVETMASVTAARLRKAPRAPPEGAWSRHNDKARLAAGFRAAG
jgi:hypothetical protein